MTIYLLIYFCLLIALGLRGSEGSSLAAVRGLLSGFGGQASHRSGVSRRRARAPGPRLSSRGTQAELLHSTWGLPGPGTKPASPALAGGFWEDQLLCIMYSK